MIKSNLFEKKMLALTYLNEIGDLNYLLENQ